MRSTSRSPVASGTSVAAATILSACGLAGRHRLLDEHRAAGRERVDIVQRRRRTGGAAVEVDHDLDVGADRRAQRLHHAGDLVDLGQRGVEMRVGDEHGLEGAIAALDHLARPLDQRGGVDRLVDGPHVAEAEVGIDAHPVAHLAAEQTPDRHAEMLAEDVPERDLDARDGAHADGAEPPEALLLHDADGLLDVARVAPDQQRRQVLDGADHGARLPFERRLAPAEQARIVGLDPHEHPVAHLGIDHDACECR